MVVPIVVGIEAMVAVAGTIEMSAETTMVAAVKTMSRRHE